MTPRLEQFHRTKLDAYDGRFDPDVHLQRYISPMDITRANDATLCYAFSLTLIEVMATWYNSLLSKKFNSLRSTLLLSLTTL